MSSISRWDIFTPVSEDKMKTEAETDIVPSSVDPVLPLSEDSHDKNNVKDEILREVRFLETRIAVFVAETFPNGLQAITNEAGEITDHHHHDDRLYYLHPFADPKFQIPSVITVKDEILDDEELNSCITFANVSTTSWLPAPDDEETLEHCKELQYLNAVGTITYPFAWYNSVYKRKRNSGINKLVRVSLEEGKSERLYIPFLGISDESLCRKNRGDAVGVGKYSGVDNPTFQKLLVATNKRLVKVWMGELKHHFSLNENQAQIPYLEEWFGTEEGRKHFRGWCEKLGKQNSHRSGGGPHGQGKAMDVNYEFNPWVPLVQTEGIHNDGTYRRRTTRVGFGKVGEKSKGTDLSGTYVPAIQVYERSLRVFIDLSKPEEQLGPEEGFNNVAYSEHLGERYYRNHHNWRLESNSELLQPTVRDVYTYYSALNWIIRFYFNFKYERMQIRKKLDETINDYTSDNKEDMHGVTDGNTGQEIWEKFKEEVDNSRLPGTSHLLILNKHFPKEEQERVDREPGESATTTLVQRLQEANILDELDVRFCFEGDGVTTRFQCLRLNTETVDAVELQNDTTIAGIGTAIAKQIEEDHDNMARGMRYKSSRRDPCNGIFNNSFNFIMALCYLLDDSSRLKLRAFGNFSPSGGGDFQHFDYDVISTKTGRSAARRDLEYSSS